MSADPIMTGFLVIWYIFDVIFGFIERAFMAVFNAIPNTAMPFLIGIACYSICAIFILIIEKQPPGKKLIYYKIFYKVFVVIMILFSIWRLGFITQLASEVSFITVSQFVINIVYIIFAAILLITFYRKIPWLKKAIVIILWTMLLIITFIVSPATGESELSDSTLIQILLIATLFVVPHGLLQYNKLKGGAE